MTWAARRSALITVTGALVIATTAITIAPASARTRPHLVPAGRTALTVPPMAAHNRPYAVHYAAAAGPRAHRAGPGVTGHAAAVTPGQQAGVRRYWTRARMADAMPLWRPGPRITGRATSRLLQAAGRLIPLRAPVGGTKHAGPARSAHPRVIQQRAAVQPQYARTTSAAQWTGAGGVAHTSGKVFFTMSGQDYVCSGSTVASGNEAVVITAAHCVKDGTGAWATNWTFVPGYHNGNAPYGGFTANQFYVASQWSEQADNDYDVAFVTVNSGGGDGGEDGSQVPVVQAVGGQGIEFSGQPAQEAAFGYPADPPYDGGQLYYCSGTVHPDPYHETDDNGLTCAMTEGSSGGPWLAGFNPATGTGTITGVSSFKYSNNSQILYGAPLGSVAQSLYQAAESS